MERWKSQAQVNVFPLLGERDRVRGTAIHFIPKLVLPIQQLSNWKNRGFPVELMRGARFVFCPSAGEPKQRLGDGHVAADFGIR